jgi:hypothetical protein
VIASQPYRARLAQLQGQARDRAAVARSAGRAPDRHPFARQRSRHEIVQKVWPGENPFIHDRHQDHEGGEAKLSPPAAISFNAYADNRSLFRYDMQRCRARSRTSSISTSTLFAA